MALTGSNLKQVLVGLRVNRVNNPCDDLLIVKKILTKALTAPDGASRCSGESSGFSRSWFRLCPNHLHRSGDGGLQAANICPTAAGKLQRGAVINRSANDR